MHRKSTVVIAAIVLLAAAHTAWNAMWLSAGVGAFSEEFAVSHPPLTTEEVLAQLEPYTDGRAQAMIANSIVLAISGVLLLAATGRQPRA